MILRICFRAPVSLIVAMTITMMINAKLASVYLIAVAFLSLVLFFLIRATHKTFKQVFEKYDDLNAGVQENVNSIRVVKAFVREHHEITKFERATLNLYTLFVKAEKMMVIVSPLMMVTVYGCIIVISWFGANMIVGGELSKGDMTSMLTYCMNILMNLMMIAFIFIMLTMSFASGERIAQVLMEEATIRSPETPDFDVPDGSIVQLLRKERAPRAQSYRPAHPRGRNHRHCGRHGQLQNKPCQPHRQALRRERGRCQSGRQGCAQL